MNQAGTQPGAGAPTDPTQVVGAPGGRQHNTATLPAIGRDPSETESKPHKVTYALLTVAVIAALVLLALAGKALFGGEKAAPTVAVPYVVSLTEKQAVDKLQAAGFVAEVSRASSEVDKGKVIDQNPKSGEKHPAKTVVTITVSSGPGEVTVPDVAGFNVDSATEAIKNVGLTVGKVDSVDDPRVDKGKVIATSPKANETVAAGSAVTLKVSSGKVKVPAVVGFARGDAQQALTDARLKYKTEFADSDKPEGTVLSQTHSGETVDIGTQIVLTVAQVPQPTAPPTTPSTTAPTTTAPPTPTIGP